MNSFEDQWKGLAGAGIEHQNPNAGGIENVTAENEQADGGRFSKTIDQIEENTAEKLASYLRNISQEKREKIDAALKAIGEDGIAAFPWVRAIHQETLQGLIDDIAISNDPIAIRKSAMACKEAIITWEQQDEER